MKRIVLEGVAAVIAAVALGWLLLGCGDNKLPQIDAGPDPEISACCEWWDPLERVLYHLPTPQACLAAHTFLDELVDGQCRWLTCLGGLVTYDECRCDGMLRDGECP